MADQEPRPPIYPAEWLDERLTPASPPPDHELQDGMRAHFERQPTDWKTAKAADREPFDYRDFLSKWARHMEGSK
jgi:hypothetical protein